MQPCIDFFMTIQDREAVAVMCTLATGNEQDIPLVAGESAVAGLAALFDLAHENGLPKRIGLDRSSRVLLISIEGATAPGVYADLVGEAHDQVLNRQKAWAASN